MGIHSLLNLPELLPVGAVFHHEVLRAHKRAVVVLTPMRYVLVRLAHDSLDGVQARLIVQWSIVARTPGGHFRYESVRISAVAEQPVFFAIQKRTDVSHHLGLSDQQLVDFREDLDELRIEIERDRFAVAGRARVDTNRSRRTCHCESAG